MLGDVLTLCGIEVVGHAPVEREHARGRVNLRTHALAHVLHDRACPALCSQDPRTSRTIFLGVALPADLGMYVDRYDFVDGVDDADTLGNQAQPAVRRFSEIEDVLGKSVLAYMGLQQEWRKDQTRGRASKARRAHLGSNSSDEVVDLLVSQRNL